MEVAVDIDDNSNSYSRLSSCYANHEEGHKHAFHTLRIEQTVDGGKVDIDGVEHQLDRDEHGNQVATRHKAIDADKEQQRTECEITFYRYIA